jgi:hypothetical protein
MVSSYHSPRDIRTQYRFRRTVEYSGFSDFGDGVWLPRVRCETLERQAKGGAWALISSSKAEAVELKANIQIPSWEFKPPSVPGILPRSQPNGPRSAPH